MLGLPPETLMNLRAGLVIIGLILTMAAQNLSSQSAPAAARDERNYTLEATMLGFRGVGGEIDGIRNPTLWALTGETVRITIVNGELMVHDIALEKLNVKSAQILDKGVSTEHHVQGEGERHLLLLGAGASRRRHGRAARGFGRSTRSA